MYARLISATLIAFAGNALAVSAQSAQGNNVEYCNQDFDPDLRIEGCSNLINEGAMGRSLALAYMNRGIGYNDKYQSDKAIADFDRAIEVMPDLAIAYYNRATVYTETGNPAKAVQNLDEAIRIDPTDPDFFDARGFALVDLRDFESAVIDFDRAIELDPGFGAAYYHRGQAYHALAKIEKALADFNKSIELGCLRQGYCPPRP